MLLIVVFRTRLLCFGCQRCLKPYQKSRSYSLRNKEAQYTGCQGQGVIIIYKSATGTARAHIHSYARARSALFAFRVFLVLHVIDGVSIMTSNDFRLERNVELSEETKAIAEEELRETPERVKEALERLRELLKENKDLYFGDDDEILTIFLRPCKWYPESAIALMRRVAEFRKENASLLDGLLPEHEIQSFLEHKVVNVLKGRDHKGRRVLVVNVGGSWDPKKVTADQLFRLFYLIHEAAMLEPESQVRGTVVIMDFHNMGWPQTWGLTPSFSKRLLTFIQDAMPLRLKEVHFVKEPMLFSAVWKMFKPFIREKLKSRIYFHGSKMSSLHKHMEPSHLPADYGGDLPAINYSGAEWYPVINEILPHIHNWNSYGFAKDS